MTFVLNNVNMGGIYHRYGSAPIGAVSQMTLLTTGLHPRLIMFKPFGLLQQSNISYQLDVPLYT